MRQLFCFALTAALALCLFACGQSAPAESTHPATTGTTATTIPTTAPAPTETAPTDPAETESTEPAPTEPEHSPLYLPDVSQEDIITWFNEVVLQVEYSTGDGDPSLVQKWVQPIRYRIYGDPTEEDTAVLEQLFTQLNTIDGFPGITPDDPEGPPEDLSIHFLDVNDFQLAFSQVIQGEYADGAVQFWYYSDTNVIYDGRIGYRTDISQDIRNSVLLEEVVNLLGITDTTLRQDSIVYQYGSEVSQLSEVDWVLLKLLYHPDIQCGMDEAACRAVLEKLYY